MLTVVVKEKKSGKVLSAKLLLTTRRSSYSKLLFLWDQKKDFKTHFCSINSKYGKNACAKRGSKLANKT